MCNPLRPIEDTAKAGEHVIDATFSLPGDAADKIDQTLDHLKPKPPLQAPAPQPTIFFADPTQQANSATAVQRRKPRSLLGAAGGGDTSTASTSTTMAKATLGA